MQPTLVIQRIASWWRSRLDHIRTEPDAGYSTEAIAVTALLVLMAVAALTAISIAVSGWVSDIVNSA